MVSLHRKLLQVGIIAGFGAFLIANAKPLPLPDIEPQIRAGASNLPVVKWQETEVEPIKVEAAIIEVSEPAPEVVVETPIETEGTTEDFWEVQPDYDELDLLYRTVQAEGYTMGVEGMQYITDSILNLSRDRGCSIYETLTSGAYTVVNTGAIWQQNVYEETIAAVNAELGGQLDYDIKYFRTNHFHGFGQPCFSFGNVYFSS